MWSFEFESEGDATVLTQRFVMQQPTEGLLQIKEQLPPEQAATFIEDRKTMLQDALRRTVEGIKESIEQ